MSDFYPMCCWLVGVDFWLSKMSVGLFADRCRRERARESERERQRERDRARKLSSFPLCFFFRSLRRNEREAAAAAAAALTENTHTKRTSSDKEEEREMAPAAKAPAAHPSYEVMIAAAIKAIKDRKGASAQVRERVYVSDLGGGGGELG